MAEALEKGVFNMWLCNLLKTKKPKWLWAFLLSDLPMFMLMLPYVCKNWTGIQEYKPFKLFAFLLVAIWTYLGPYLIACWFEEFQTFIVQIDSIPGSNNTVSNTFKAQDLIFRTNVVSIVWVCIIVVILVSQNARVRLKEYFFFGFSDPNYWCFLMCVGYVAFQTSIFFHSFLYLRSAIKSIMNNKKIVRTLISNEGKKKRLSLTLIGDIISKTAFNFCSGFLFFPIMVIFFFELKENQDTPFEVSALIFVLMGIFVMVIILYLISMKKIVVDNAQTEKDSMLNGLEEKKKRLIAKQRRTLASNKAIYYKMGEEHIDRKICYIAEININPISSNQRMQVLSGLGISVFIPAIINFLLQRYQ